MSTWPKSKSRLVSSQPGWAGGCNCSVPVLNFGGLRYPGGASASFRLPVVVAHRRRVCPPTGSTAGCALSGRRVCPPPHQPSPLTWLVPARDGAQDLAFGSPCANPPPDRPSPFGSTSPTPPQGGSDTWARTRTLARFRCAEFFRGTRIPRFPVPVAGFLQSGYSHWWPLRKTIGSFRGTTGSSLKGPVKAPNVA